MASYPPPYPPPPGYDPRDQRRFYRDQARAQRDAFRAQSDQMRYQMRSMRRGSVAGPILMIAIGVVFLLVETGHIDHTRFWGWYAQWWPLLLVGVGVVVLIEWAVDQYAMRNPEHPQYRRSLGGGIFLLVCILGFIGFVSDHSIFHHLDGQARLAGFNIDQDSWDQFFGDKHESDETLDLAFNGDALNVSNPRGDVTINGTSDDGRIHIAMHKQVYARSDSDAQDKARQLVPVPVTQGSAFTLRMPSIDGGHADLVITVPPNAATTVTADRGDIKVASIKAAVNATANHGGIELSAISGAVTAHINSGGSSLSAHSLGDGMAVQGHAQDLTLVDITGPVLINGEFFGTTHLEHINGEIHFHTSRTDLRFARLDGQTEITSSGISSDQVLGPVVLATSNRSVTLDRIAGDVAVTNRNGAITLTAAPGLETSTCRIAMRPST